MPTTARKKNFRPPQVSLRWFVTCLFALFALLGCSPTTTVKRVDGYRGKALADPFLALARLLDENFYTFEKVYNYEALREPSTVMVVSAQVEEATLQLLLAEASKRHGHIMFCLNGTRPFVKDHRPSFWSLLSGQVDHTPLLEKLGLSLNTSVRSKSPTSTATAKQTFKTLPNMPKGNYSMEPPDDITLNARLVSKNKILWSASSDLAATPALTLNYQNATVTVLATASPFRNFYLPNADHAAFFLDFLTAWEADSIAYFQGQRKTLFTLLKEHFGKTCLAVLILLVAWLWHKMPRFGPLMIAKHGNQTARFTDHLKLSGNFLWRRGQSGSLLNGLRNAILAQIRLRHPYWNGLSDEALLPKLADFAQISLDSLEAAWNSEYEVEPAKFTDYASTLQKVLELAKHGKAA